MESINQSCVASNRNPFQSNRPAQKGFIETMKEWFFGSARAIGNDIANTAVYASQALPKHLKLASFTDGREVTHREGMLQR